MKKVLSIFSAFAVFAAFGIDANTVHDDIPGTAKIGELVVIGGAATKSYVDSATNATLQAAKEYTDAHSGTGGITTNDVCNIVTNTIKEFTEWAVTPYMDGTGETWHIRWDSWYDPFEEIDYTGWGFYSSDGIVCAAEAPNRTSRDALFLRNLINQERTASRTIIKRNSLGLARLVDIPSTNGLASAADVVAATNGLPDWTKSQAKPTYTAAEVGAVPITGGTLVSSGTAEKKIDIILKRTSSTIMLGDIGAEGSNYGDVFIRSNADGGTIEVNGTNVMDAIAEKLDAGATNGIPEAIAATRAMISADNAIFSNAVDTVAVGVVAAAETSYHATNTIVALNQSAQYAAVASGASLTILAPAAVAGGIRDWIVYANAAADDTPLILPSGQWYAADPASTNALKAGVTVLYITEVPSGGFVLGRQELKPITISE